MIVAIVLTVVSVPTLTLRRPHSWRGYSIYVSPPGATEVAIFFGGSDDKRSIDLNGRRM